MDSSNRRTLCPDNAWAIPVPGTWSDSGDNYQGTSGDWVSFACRQSAASKCTLYLWNWWDKPDQFHAYTRMLRSDFCGTGDPATFDGTTIETYVPNTTDERPFNIHATAFDTTTAQWISNPPSEPNDVTSGDLWMEAAWRTTVDTTHSDYDIYRGQAACLSKLRWHSLPPGGLCSGASNPLPDPRTDNSGGSYCDDYQTVGELATNPALDADIISESQFNDVMLWSWNVSGGGTRATTQYTHEDTPTAFAAVGAPTHEGILFTENGMNALSAEYGAGEFLLLRTWVDTAGKYITTTQDLSSDSSYSQVRTEGYVFTTASNAQDYADIGGLGTAPLYRYQIAGEWVTSATNGPGSVVEGYVLTY